MSNSNLTKGVLLFILFFFNLPFAVCNENQKLDSLLQLSDQYVQIDSFTSAIEVLNSALDIYEYKGDWENYHKTADIVLDYAKKSGDKSNIAEFNNKMGISSCLNGKNNEAIEYFNKALATYKEIGDERGLSNSLENIGLVYKDMGQYEIALEYQMESLKIREIINDSRLSHTYSNISQLFEFIGEYNKQLEYIRKAQTEAKKHLDNLELQAIVCCELGEYFATIPKMVDSSIYYFNIGLEHCNIANWKRGIAVFLGNLANAYYSKGDIQKSIDMHKSSLNLDVELNDCMGICEQYNSLTELYIEKKNLSKAKEMNQKAIQQTKTCDIPYELSRAYNIASQLYELDGNYNKALSYFKLYHILSDSLIGSKKQNAILELDKKYETEKKEQQIELLSTANELKNQRLKTSLALIAVLILAIAIAIVLYMFRRRKTQQREDELQQKLLRSQMNPHFIFNALGSIQNYMYKNELKKAAGYLGNFASLTRSILEKSSKELIPLEDELSMLRNYIELERMRMQENFNYTINVDENLEAEFLLVPPMMIQPFVENAIKHGLSGKSENGILSLSVTESNKLIKFIVEDNGVGVIASAQSKKKGHRSMSMQIFEERKKLMEKKIKKSIHYSVEDLSEVEIGKTGSRITIYFPQIEMQ